MTRIMNYISLVLLSLIFTTVKADVNLIEKTKKNNGNKKIYKIFFKYHFLITKKVCNKTKAG